MLTGIKIFQMVANSMNDVMGGFCDVTVETTVNQYYKMCLHGFPMYPRGLGCLVAMYPKSGYRVDEGGGIICRTVQPHEIRIYNGPDESSTKALVHTNIFDDGHPCLGSGSGAVVIRDIFDFAAYVVASSLRINMTSQSFLSPTTRKYGSTPEEMMQFRGRVRRMLEKHLGSRVMSLDYSEIYDEIRETFNDQYRLAVR